MEITVVLLLSAVFGLSVGIIYLHAKKIISERQLYYNKKQINKEREATKAVLELSGNAVTADISDETFLADFCKYAQRSIGGNGAAVFTVIDNKLQGISVSGTFPPLKELPHQVESQLIAHSKRHSEFIRDMHIPFTLDDVKIWLGDNGYAFFKEEQFPKQLPKTFSNIAKRIVIAPIKNFNKTIALVMVVSGNDFDTHILDENDCRYLVWINEISALVLNDIRIFREKRVYEQNLQTAREEGMLQVSAGIIHNIGNAVTVAKLNVVELRDKNQSLSADSPESLIINEMIPELKKHVEKGDLDNFLSKDPSGSQFLDIIHELISHVSVKSNENMKLASSLANKLNHISEIIELQQRFIGELGTENLSSLAPVVKSAIKIFEETFSKKAVFLETDIATGLPEILIDTSMIAQVYINFIKNAVEAMETENALKDKKIKITIKTETKDGKKFVVSEIIDNGPGISPENLSKMFKFGFSTKEKSRHSRGYGLHSCMETIRKYGGNIEVKSTLGEGTTFIITLPAP